MGRFFHGEDKRQPDLIKLRALPSGALGFPRVAGLRVRSGHLPIPSDRNHGVTGSGGQRHPDRNSDESRSCTANDACAVEQYEWCGRCQLHRRCWAGENRPPQVDAKARLPQAGIGYRPEVGGGGTAVLASLRSRLNAALIIVVAREEPRATKLRRCGDRSAMQLPASTPAHLLAAVAPPPRR